MGSTCDQNTLKICMKFSKINILYMYVCTVSKYPFKEEGIENTHTISQVWGFVAHAMLLINGTRLDY